jgi:sigma-B regulation protein RsbU (phosphoserine phosphatase)
LWRVNEHLLTMNDAGLFVTMLYGILDGSTGTFRYARAGHEFPLVASAHCARALIASGPTLPVGIEPNLPLDEQTVMLPPGTTLLLYTDGLTDAYDPQGSQFGLERVRTCLQDYAHAPAQVVCDRLLRAVTQHQDAAQQHDDVTLVAVHVGAPTLDDEDRGAY